MGWPHRATVANVLAVVSRDPPTPVPPPGGAPIGAPAGRGAGLRLVLDSREARGFFLAACTLAPLVELSLRLRGVEHTFRTAAALTRLPVPVPAVPLAAGERLVAAAFRLSPGGGRCLSRSVVHGILRLRAGLPAAVVIGVQRGGAAALSLDAHAWVEDPRGGPPPRDAAGFTPIARWEGGALS